MSDDLVKRLQYLGRVAKDYDQEHMTSADYEMISAVTKQAKDRIKELVEDKKELTLQLLAAHGQAADALDKLDKAMAALQFFAALNSDFARAALAQLEGGK